MVRGQGSRAYADIRWLLPLPALDKAKTKYGRKPPSLKRCTTAIVCDNQGVQVFIFKETTLSIEACGSDQQRGYTLCRNDEPL